MLDTVPDEVVFHLLRLMQNYNEEKKNSAKRKMDEFMRTCKATADGGTATERLKKRYGSLTDALTGILPPSPDYKTAKNEALKEKYEIDY